MREMKTTLKPRSFLLLTTISAMVLIMIGGCASKTYLHTYAQNEFNPNNIKKVSIVLENMGLKNTESYLFGEIFVQTVLEKKKFDIVPSEFILKKDISSNPKLLRKTEAFLKIGLTHCHAGWQTQDLPTSVGAYAKLVDIKTGKILWNLNHTHTSENTGSDAPTIEAVMRIMAERMIASTPLKASAPSPPAPAKQEETIKEDQLASIQKILETEKNYAREISALRTEIADLKKTTKRIDSYLVQTLGQHTKQTETLKETDLASIQKILATEKNYAREISALRTEIADLRKTIRRINSYIVQKPGQQTAVKKNENTGNIKLKERTENSQSKRKAIRQDEKPQKMLEKSKVLPKKGFSLQVGAFLTTHRADKIMKLMEKKGFEPSLYSKSNPKGKVWHTVRIGDYTTRESAYKAAAAFFAKEKMQVAVRPIDEL